MMSERARPMLARAGTVGAVLLLTGFWGCHAAPPPFVIQEQSPALDRRPSRSLVVGNRETPPPGNYRYARVYPDGRVEAVELFTVNGPGPALTYQGTVTIDASVAQKLLDDAEGAVRDPAAENAGRPCVLSVVSTSGDRWQGCVAASLALQLLSLVPRLTPPEISACADPVCQLRMVTEAPARRYERYATVEEDIVLDRNGAFWCAARRPDGQTNTLVVARGRIAAGSADRFMRWVVGDAAPDSAGSHPRASSGPRVEVRGSEGTWRGLPEGAADGVRARWTRIAGDFPPQCRSAR